jgi:glucosamine--fructose-6-phosphate aminotransferase (isomerizing)
MCGIIGYIGDKQVVPVLLDGLERLEYRGYDSAGIATVSAGRLHICRCVGKIAALREAVKTKDIKGKIGLGHTRWATHGRPSEENAHPHTDCKGNLVIVHNGIIENYLPLKLGLEKKGHKFKSDTDTEVLVHLIEEYFKTDLEEAIRKALKEVRGSYALGVMCLKEPSRLFGARSRSPLVIGISGNEHFIASDIPAVLKHTRDIVYLDNNEMCILTPTGYKVKTLDNRVVDKKPVKIEWDIVAAEKQGFSHFMLKEIFEQPGAIEETLSERFSEDKGEIYLDKLGLTKKELKDINRIIITGCGTSWHAGLIGEYFIEEHARLPVEVEYAAEFRYRDPVLDKRCLVIAISQSGETADTLAAVEEVQAKGSKVVSICNVVGSSITREADGVIYTRAGPEIGVASTKAFTTQLTVLYLFSMFFGKLRSVIPLETLKEMLIDLRQLPHKVDLLLERSNEIKEIAEKYYKSSNFLYLGRGTGYPIALEGALKLKEISYIHAEGMPAAEMKHGPIALIDQYMPTVVLAFKGQRYEKILGNIEEIKSRGGKIIALVSQGNEDIKKKVDDVIYIPDVPASISSIMAVIPLQLLAFYIAVERGCEVDQPRNLAKSVTVE